MNYTREPIIETVITPKDGSKLVLRSSKRQSDQEDYFVDAVEIVSFGTALIFRSLERPKPFLLPVTDYEVLELRETKMVLKSASLDKSIKIGGGKEPGKPSNSDDKEKRAPKKKTRRRRHPQSAENTQKSEVSSPKQTTEKEPVDEAKGGDKNDETLVSSSVVSCLITPPPQILIKDKLSQYKAHIDAQESAISEEKVEKTPKKEGKKVSKKPDTESTNEVSAKDKESSDKKSKEDKEIDAPN